VTLTRRNFLKLAGLGGAGLVLGLRETARPAPTLRLLAPARSLSPATFAGFTAVSGVGVQLFYGTPAIDTRNYDLVVAPVPELIRLLGRGWVRELGPMDSPPPLEQRVYDPLNTFSLPAARGAIGINTRGVIPPASWAEFFALARTEPVHLPPAETFRAALKSLGHSINTRNTFTRADAQSLVSGLQSSPLERVVLALSHSLGDGWTFTLPIEGAESWEDCFCIPTGSPHPGLAHTFIQFALAAQPLAPLPWGALEPLSPFASV